MIQPTPNHQTLFRQIILLGFLLLQFTLQVEAQEHRVVMFYRDGGGASSAIRWDLFTHLIWFDNQAVDTNGVYTPPAGSRLSWLQERRDIGQANGRKVMYGIAGGMADFTNMMQNATLRATFVQGVADFVRTNDLDGVDFDIEYPYSASEQSALATFLTDMRTALGRQLLLTADGAFWSAQIGAATINNQLDWVNIMDYYHMAATPSQTAYAQTTLQTYLNAGVWPSKLVLGVGFAGKSPSGGFDFAYSSLVNFISPHNEAQDIVTNGSGTIYYLSGNRDTQRDKVDLAITNANGTMCWHLLADTTNTITSLAVALNDQRTNQLAVLDGFEYPTNTWLDSLYTNRSSCTLGVTNERVAGDAALLMTVSYSGAQYSGGSFRSPTFSNAWNFPGTARLRLDLRTLDVVTNGTFYFTLYDGAGRSASHFNTTILRTNAGWVRLLLTTNQFQTVSAGFDWSDIRQHRFLTQLAVAGSASSRRLLLDNFGLFQPDPSARPARTDLGAAPLVTSPPTNQTVIRGTTAVLGAAATGTGQLAYQWQRNSTNLSGSNNASLTLPNVTTNDAASYRIVVSNAFGVTLSSPAVLTVVPPPAPVVTQVTQLGVGQFYIAGVGVSGLPYTLLGASNLVPPVTWQALATNTTDLAGLFQFTNSQPPGRQQYFFRVSAP